MELRYYKNVIDGHIFAVANGQGGEEITEAEYEAILSRLAEKPADEEGYRWLMVDGTLEWERQEMPHTDEVDAAEALDIITGEVTE